MPAEYFEARERALLGERYDALYYTLLLQRIAYYYDSVASPALSSQYTQETADATASAPPA